MQFEDCFSLRIAAALTASGLIAVIAPEAAFAVTSSAFSATCTGRASAAANSTMGYASASGTCHGSLFGAGTFSASATGDTSHPPCAPFAGRGSIRSPVGRITLTAPAGARACAAAQTSATDVTFSGTATVSGGTAKFRHAHGTIAFSGRYDGVSDAITIRLKGDIRLAG